MAAIKENMLMYKKKTKKVAKGALSLTRGKTKKVAKDFLIVKREKNKNSGKWLP